MSLKISKELKVRQEWMKSQRWGQTKQTAKSIEKETEKEHKMKYKQTMTLCYPESQVCYINSQIDMVITYLKDSHLNNYLYQVD